MMEFDPAATPEDIIVAADRASMLMVWPDRAVRLDGALLRASCRCGPCSAARARGAFVAPASGTGTIAAIHPFGGHALNLVFGDGHDRGVFPWTYLREIALAAAE